MTNKNIKILIKYALTNKLKKRIKTDELEDACESVIEVIDDENNSTIETTKAIEAGPGSFDSAGSGKHRKDQGQLS